MKYMASYQLELPRRIVFGENSLEKLGDWPEFRRKILIVCGASAVRNGLTERLQNALPDGTACTVFDRVAPEPTLALLAQVCEAVRSSGAEAVVALGGGSAMDVGKVAAAVARENVPVEEYFYKRRPVPCGGLPFAALPTTAGTGAEVTPNAVLIDEATGIKQSVRSAYLLPGLALVDPALSMSCPPRVTAASGMDALTQGMESYISRKASRATRPLALEGVKLIWNALPAAYRDGSDPAARSAMAEGTLLGAMAFGASGLGAVHGLAHPVGAKTHLGHGLVCGRLLPAVLRWNLPAAEEAMTEMAHALGLPDAEALIEGVERLLRTLDFPEKLGPPGLKEEDFDWIVANSRSGSMKCNPRDFSDGELKKILAEVL